MWDLSSVSESGLPAAGDYTVTCVDSELKETKSGTGEMIKVKFEADSGQIFFHSFNVKNDNPKAVEIGMGQLKKFLRVGGAKDPNSLKSVNTLLGLKCVITVKIDEGKGEYGPQARITNFKPAAKANPADPFA
jgi:hypothetical protein